MFVQERKQNVFLKAINEIVNEIFKISLISFLLFYLIESIKQGFISDFFNSNILLYIIIISGIFALSWKKELEINQIMPVKIRDYVFIALLGIATSCLIYYFIKEIGLISYIISIISGIIIILLSVMLLRENTDWPGNNKD